MNILILSSNSRYKETFEKNIEIELALQNTELKQVNVPIKAIFIDGETFSIDYLQEIREVFQEQPIFFKPKAINSDVIMKSITRLCAAYKTQLLNEHQSIEQVVEEILNRITNRNEHLNKRVVSFFGTHSGAGVSTTILSVARALSQRVHEKVLVLSLNAWDPSDYFYHYEGHYLNDLKVDLKTQSLTQTRLQEAVHYVDSFYHLAGNRDIKMQRFYQPSEIQHLIQVAKEVFDIILIDGGPHFDTAPSVQSYLSSNLRFLVTNQEEKGYRGYFPYVFQQLIEPTGGKSNDFMLIINRYQPSNTLINEKSLEEELDMVKVSTLPDMGELGTLSAFQKKLLYDVAESYYTKGIDVIANLIISETKLTEKELSKEGKSAKKGLFSKLF